MNPFELHQQNRLAWNEAAARYEEEVSSDLQALKGGEHNLQAVEVAVLEPILASCGRAIHIQCAGGFDTLSLWKLGAREVIGVDISDRMIGCAQAKTAALGAPAQWFCCDVLQTPHSLDGTADLVYTGKGAICWLMDLTAWAKVVNRLLKPGGRFFVYEGHPIQNVWQLNSEVLALDPEFGDYFRREPVPSRGWGPEYIGDLGKPGEECEVKNEMFWSLGDILTALAREGLVLEVLEEHAKPFYELPCLSADIKEKLPNSFIALFRKPE